MIKQYCLQLDPNSLPVISLLRKQLITQSMGHLVSKRRRMDLDSLPQGSVSFTEGVPPQYLSQEEGTVGAIHDFTTSSNSISMEWETPRQASEQQNSKQDCQRQSIYSTMDAVPHLEFYTNSIGHQRRTRPSLEILRKVSEVSNPIANLLIIIKKIFKFFCD